MLFWADTALNTYDYKATFANYRSSFNSGYFTSSYENKPVFNYNFRDYSFIPTFDYKSKPLFNFSLNSYSYAPSQFRVYGDSASSSKTYYTPRRTGSYRGNRSEYAGLSQSLAYQRAKGDSRLEYIGNGGNGWNVSKGDFQNDIEYATAGTTRLLNEVVAQIRKTDPTFNLTVTSALGTSSSPHRAAGHYCVENVKLDFGGGMSKTKASKVAGQLMSTGKFDFANIECDGSTWHIDAQFKKELLA